MFFSPVDSTSIIAGTPRTKANLTLTYSYKKISATLRNVYSGDVSRNGFPYGPLQKFKGKVVTDIPFSYALNHVTILLAPIIFLMFFLMKRLMPTAISASLNTHLYRWEPAELSFLAG